MASEMRVAPDGYGLGKRLHSTPHAEVYEAVRVADGAEVVLKAYLGDRNTDRRPHAQREFDALRRIPRPGIPRALDLDRGGEAPVLVLERLPGAALTRALADGPLAVDVWLELAIQLAHILAHVHDARILHKDLSPNNVLVESRGERIWIVDFGLATELELRWVAWLLGSQEEIELAHRPVPDLSTFGSLIA